MSVECSVLSSVSEKLHCWVEIRLLVWSMKNIPLYYLDKLLVSVHCMFRVIVYLLYEALSYQICSIWLTLTERTAHTLYLIHPDTLTSSRFIDKHDPSYHV